MRSATVRISGGSVDAAGSAPASLFTLSAGNAVDAVIEDADLSKVTGNIVSAATDSSGSIRGRNCKMGSGFSLITGAIQGPSALEVLFENCDSGATNYKLWHEKYAGQVKTGTTVVRTGGYSDGTVPQALIAVSSANTSFIAPLEIPIAPMWHDGTSAVTATVEICQANGATALTESEVWLEVEYLSDAGSPLGAKGTDHNSTVLALSGTAQTTSTVTWSSPDNQVKQKLAVTFTPAQKGPVYAKVMLAKASTTINVDPVMTIA